MSHSNSQDMHYTRSTEGNKLKKIFEENILKNYFFIEDVIKLLKSKVKTEFKNICEQILEKIKKNILQILKVIQILLIIEGNESEKLDTKSLENETFTNGFINYFKNYLDKIIVLDGDNLIQHKISITVNTTNNNIIYEYNKIDNIEIDKIEIDKIISKDQFIFTIKRIIFKICNFTKLNILKNEGQLIIHFEDKDTISDLIDKIVDRINDNSIITNHKNEFKEALKYDESCKLKLDEIDGNSISYLKIEELVSRLKEKEDEEEINKNKKLVAAAAAAAAATPQPMTAILSDAETAAEQYKNNDFYHYYIKNELLKEDLPQGINDIQCKRIILYLLLQERYNFNYSKLSKTYIKKYIELFSKINNNTNENTNESNQNTNESNQNTIVLNLLYSSISDPNPIKDVRIKEFYEIFKIFSNTYKYRKAIGEYLSLHPDSDNKNKYLFTINSYLENDYMPSILKYYLISNNDPNNIQKNIKKFINCNLLNTLEDSNETFVKIIRIAECHEGINVKNSIINRSACKVNTNYKTYKDYIKNKYIFLQLKPENNPRRNNGRKNLAVKKTDFDFDFYIDGNNNKKLHMIDVFKILEQIDKDGLESYLKNILDITDDQILKKTEQMNFFYKSNFLYDTQKKRVDDETEPELIYTYDGRLTYLIPRVNEDMFNTDPKNNYIINSIIDTTYENIEKNNFYKINEINISNYKQMHYNYYLILDDFIINNNITTNGDKIDFEYYSKKYSKIKQLLKILKDKKNDKIKKGDEIEKDGSNINDNSSRNNISSNQKPQDSNLSELISKFTELHKSINELELDNNELNNDALFVSSQDFHDEDKKKILLISYILNYEIY